MDLVITPFWLMVILVMGGCFLGVVLEPKYFWIVILGLAAGFSDHELSIHANAEKISISYVPPKPGEKGGAL